MSWSLLGVHERVNSQMIQRNRTLIWAELRFFFSVVTDELHLFLSRAFCITCTYVLKGNFYFSFLPIVSSVIA